MEMEVSISLHWLPGHLQCKEETIISILFFWGQGFFHSNNSSVRHYALIQKLIPGHKMKTVLMPNSLNSEIINTPIMLQVLQVHQYYQFVYEQVRKLMIASQYSIVHVFDSKNKTSWIQARNHTYCKYMYFFQIFMNILDKSSEKFKSNQFKTLIIQNR